MALLPQIVIAVTFWFASANSVVLTTEVLSSVVITMYGDRTPYILPGDLTLTPLGAQQLYQAGTNFRNRYMVPQNDSSTQSDTTITGIERYQLDNTQISILSTNDEHVIDSATAFIQGLYPPLGDYSQPTLDLSLSMLANGTNIQAPLNGYQYPKLDTASYLDLDYVWVAGMSNCPMYDAEVVEYMKSNEYQLIQVSEANFYESLEPNILGGVFTDVQVGYYDSYLIWDYVRYGVVHNSSIADSISSADLTKLRLLADNWVFALNGNVTDFIQPIAGRTLARRIVDSLWDNVQSSGQYNKMTMLFGSFEPMVSLAALIGLPSFEHEIFYTIPEMGSSMVFELVALIEDGNQVGYPSDQSDLFVRFFYQNGTEEGSDLVNYPLFGLDPDQSMISFGDFLLGMEKIMVYSVGDWCSACDSGSVFCSIYDSSNTSGQTSRAGKLTPAIAGVIGAMVTLVVLALVVSAAMLLFGLRCFRVKSKRRSELAGFKGAEKLASDQDLTIPKGGAGAVVTAGEAGNFRGHERVGSWELNDSNKAEEGQRPIDRVAGSVPRRPSYEEDDLHVTPYASPVKTNEQV